MGIGLTKKKEKAILSAGIIIITAVLLFIISSGCAVHPGNSTGPTQTPAQTATQTPAQTATQTPAQTATQTPAQTATQTPAQSATQMPALKPTTDGSTADVKITYPSDSAIVNITETIIGTAKNIPEGQQLWIAIYPHTASKYYPQNPVSIESNGNWDLPVQFGGALNAGEKFDIIALLADDNAQKKLINYIETSEKAKLFKGVRILPDGSKIITKLTVIRA
jgi:hypothetical protein